MYYIHTFTIEIFLLSTWIKDFIYCWTFESFLISSKMSMIFRCSFVQLWCHVMLRCTSNFWTTCNLHHQTPKCRNLWCDILVFKMSFFVLSLLFVCMYYQLPNRCTFTCDWFGSKNPTRKLNSSTNWTSLVPKYLKIRDLGTNNKGSFIVRQKTFIFLLN